MKHFISLILLCLLFSHNANASFTTDSYNGSTCFPWTVVDNGVERAQLKYSIQGSKLTFSFAPVTCNIPLIGDRRSVDLSSVLINAKVFGSATMSASLCYYDSFRMNETCGPAITMNQYSFNVQFLYPPQPKPTDARAVYLTLSNWSRSGKAVLYSYIPFFRNDAS